MLIANEETIASFFYNLPPLKDNEIYYMHVLERPKHISNDTKMLFRSSGNQRQIMRDLKRVDVLMRCGNMDGEWTRQGVCAYLGINPRDQVRCAGGIVKQLVDDTLIHKKDSINLHSLFFNQIQNYGIVSNYLIIDLDCVNQDGERLVSVQDIVNVLCEVSQGLPLNNLIIETRGGYHLALKTSDLGLMNQWYKHVNIVLGGYIDQKGNQLLTPIPGTYQGTHEVKFYNPTLALKENNE